METKTSTHPSDRYDGLTPSTHPSDRYDGLTPSTHPSDRYDGLTPSTDLFTQAVQRSYQCMSNFEKFRKKYPKEIKYERCDTDNCPWCYRDLTIWKHNFTEADLKKAGSYSCKYDIEEEMYDLNHSGIEPCLFGQYLTDMVEMNKYVVTTESTCWPDQTIHEDDVNPMYVRFNVPMSLALKICSFIDEKYPEYLYGIVDTVEKKAIGAKSSYEGIFYVDKLIDRWVEHGSYFPWTDMDQLFEGEDRLVEVMIEDSDYERRDLYSNLLGVLKNVCPNRLKS